MDFTHSRHSDHKAKVFPRRVSYTSTQLPDNYHGQTKPRLKLASLHQQKAKERDSHKEDMLRNRIVNWQKKRLDQDVIAQRKHMIVHPGKLSEEIPGWCKTTYDYFRRSEQKPKVRETREQWEKFDVFGREKKITFAEENRMGHRMSLAFNVTAKVGWMQRGRSTTLGFSKEVTPKVGSVETRNFSIRQPQMKVGKADCINTYSPF